MGQPNRSITNHEFEFSISYLWAHNVCEEISDSNFEAIYNSVLSQNNALRYVSGKKGQEILLRQFFYMSIEAQITHK
jgi:hypothetical protein